jgi:hypothetical protein
VPAAQELVTGILLGEYQRKAPGRTDPVAAQKGIDRFGELRGLEIGPRLALEYTDRAALMAIVSE